jgi:hypothetical protein
MRSNLLPQWIRHRRVEARRNAKAADAISTDLGQPLRIGHRKASESDRINQLKDGGVCADAKSQRKDRDRSKHGSASKNSETVLCVADEVVHNLGRAERKHIWTSSLREEGKHKIRRGQARIARFEWGDDRQGETVKGCARESHRADVFASVTDPLRTRLRTAAMRTPRRL